MRTIRLDPSDTFVFDSVAEPGEWAVSGAFAFWDRDPATLEGKRRTAFRSGFLGVVSLGRATLVQVVAASDDDRAQLVEALANQLMAHFGAPDRDAAITAAEDEVTFAESLCLQPVDTLIAVHRTVEDGAIREQFRTLRPRDGAAKPARAFSFLEVEGEDGDGAEERVDLVGMAGSAERETK